MLTLLYHNILPTPSDNLPVAEGQVTVETFRNHVHRLRSRLVHPLEAHEQLSKRRTPRGILISFDDGAEGIVEAGRILAEVGAAGVAFVCPGALKAGLWFYKLADVLVRCTVPSIRWSQFYLPLSCPLERQRAYRLLSNELFDLPANERDDCLLEIEAALRTAPGKPNSALTTLDEVGLERAGNTRGLVFANHSWSHPNLIKLSFADLEYEVETAQAWLRSSGLPILPWFAFPRGNHDARVRTVVSRLCTTSFGANAYESQGDVLPRTYICELDANPLRFFAKTVREGRLRRLLSFGNGQRQPVSPLAT